MSGAPGGIDTRRGDVGRSEVPIRVEDDDGVRCVTLDRPEKLNAMTESMFDRISEVLIDASLNPSISCVVLTGTGRAFCTGWDLAEMGANPTRDDRRRHGPEPCIEELARFPKPIIAAVNGLAVGFGATTPLHCDMVLVSTEARFRFPFAELGLAGESGCTVTLPLRVGYQQAARLLFTSDWVHADEAVSLGMALKAVVPEQLLAEALTLAGRIARMPTEALMGTKKLLLAGKSRDVNAALERELEAYARLLGGPANLAAIEALTNHSRNGGKK